ncbi:hypothetical protein N9B94_04535 [Verrucomicrobia bacterium]|nr:hypothetical protein [Verrucomicrobiota bacterium]
MSGTRTLLSPTSRRDNFDKDGVSVFFSAPGIAHRNGTAEQPLSQFQNGESHIFRALLLTSTHNNPRRTQSFNSLVAYFRANTKEATRAKVIIEWYSFLFALNNEGGVGFMVDQLQSDQSMNAEWAYETLSDKPLSLELLRHAITQLESVALRSADTVVRTRAKLLVQRFGERLGNPKLEPDSRSLFSILKDIEREVRKLTQEMEQADQTTADNVLKYAPEE